ncbi:hypothetical protein KI387_034474, partial [Taxus chinensis]
VFLTKISVELSVCHHRFVLSLAGVDHELLMEGETQVWTSNDVVIVLQHENKEIPLSAVLRCFFRLSRFRVELDRLDRSGIKLVHQSRLYTGLGKKTLKQSNRSVPVPVRPTFPVPLLVPLLVSCQTEFSENFKGLFSARERLFDPHVGYLIRMQ